MLMADLGGGFAGTGISGKTSSPLYMFGHLYNKTMVKMVGEYEHLYSGLWFPSPGWRWDQGEKETQTLRSKHATSTALRMFYFLSRGVCVLLSLVLLMFLWIYYIAQ